MLCNVIAAFLECLGMKRFYFIKTPSLPCPQADFPEFVKYLGLE